MPEISDDLLASLGKMLNDEYMACHVDYYNLINKLNKAGLNEDADLLRENIDDECKHFNRVKRVLDYAMKQRKDEGGLSALFG